MLHLNINPYMMKTSSFIVGLISIIIVVLDIASSTPEFHMGTDGRQYIIETEHKVIFHKTIITFLINIFYIKNPVQLASGIS